MATVMFAGCPLCHSGPCPTHEQQEQEIAEFDRTVIAEGFLGVVANRGRVWTRADSRFALGSVKLLRPLEHARDASRKPRGKVADASLIQPSWT